MPYLILTYFYGEGLTKPIVNIETTDDPQPTPICPFAQTLPVVPICMFSQQTESQVILGFNFNDPRGFRINTIKEELLPFDVQKSLSKLDHTSKPKRSKRRTRALEDLSDVNFGESMSSPDPLLLDTKTKPRRLRPRNTQRKSLAEPRVTKKKGKTNKGSIKCTYPECDSTFRSTGNMMIHRKTVHHS